ENAQEELPAVARAPIERALAREKTIESDVAGGKTIPPSSGRIGSLIDAVNAALQLAGGTNGDQARASSLARIRSGLLAGAKKAGLEIFPEDDALAPELLATPGAVEVEPPFEHRGGPRGRVVSVSQLGTRKGGVVQRPARV